MIKLNVDQYSEIWMIISFYNLISIENLLAISVHYFEIFRRSRHLYDFPILLIGYINNCIKLNIIENKQQALVETETIVNVRIML
jgi:hypothetical protein